MDKCQTNGGFMNVRIWLCNILIKSFELWEKKAKTEKNWKYWTY